MSAAAPTDMEDVVAVIRAEHVAFWMQDHDAYDRCHLHATHTWWWSYWRHGGLAIRHGWAEIGQRSRQAMAAFHAPSPSYAYETTWSDMDVRVSGTMAWATYQLHYPSSDGPIGNLPGHTSLAFELRVLEKYQDEWKIALASVMVPGLDQLGGPVLRLDAEGRILWKSEDAETVLEDDADLVVRNGRLRTRDHATDLKLQAAIQWAARLDGFLMARRGAMPIITGCGGRCANQVVVGDCRIRHDPFFVRQPSPCRGTPRDGRSGVWPVPVPVEAGWQHRGGTVSRRHCRDEPGECQHRPHPAQAHVRQGWGPQPDGAGAGVALGSRAAMTVVTRSGDSRPGQDQPISGG
jgi:hypothetical protein